MYGTTSYGMKTLIYSVYVQWNDILHWVDLFLLNLSPVWWTRMNRVFYILSCFVKTEQQTWNQLSIIFKIYIISAIHFIAMIFFHALCISGQLHVKWIQYFFFQKSLQVFFKFIRLISLCYVPSNNNKKNSDHMIFIQDYQSIISTLQYSAVQLIFCVSLINYLTL